MKSRQYNAIYSIFSCFVCLVLLFSIIFAEPSTAYATNYQSTSSGWDTLVNDGILDKITMGSATFQGELYNIIVNNKMTKLGSTYFNSGYSAGGTQCWGFAETVMKTLVGKGAPSGSGRTSGGSVPNLRGATSFTYNSFVQNGIPQRGATLIRTQASDYFNSEYDNGNGHSMVLLYYDKTNVYFLHSYKSDSKTYHNSLTKQTWSQWTSERLTSGSRKIKYIVTVSDSVIKSRYSDTGGIKPSVFEFRNVTYPKTYKINSNGWNLSGGILASDQTLTSIDSKIISSDGTVVSQMSSPMTITGNIFSIKNLDGTSVSDNGQRFSKIQNAGNYTWRLTAKDNIGRTLVLDLPITAVSSGSTSTTTASIQYSGANPVVVTGVTLSKESATITKGSTLSLIAVVSPSNATNKSVTWKSSNQSVATVDSNGTVTAVAPGTATITATTSSGGKTASCVITVPDNTVLEFKSVTCPVNYKVGTSGGYKLSGGTLVSNEELKTITSTIKKSDGTVISGPKTRNISGKSYNIKSLDTMETSDNGVHFSWIKSNGNYVWILTATDAKRTLTLEMPFTASSNATTSHNVSIAYASITNIVLDKSNETLMTGDTIALTATLSPDNAANKNIIWSSNNQSVATVDGNGTVKAVSEGSAVITAITEDGGKTASCTISVIDFFSHTKRIGISFPTQELERWQKDGQSLQSKLESAGYETELLYAGNSAQTQIDQIYDMMNNGCDLLIVACVDPYSLDIVLSRASDKEIPVISYDRLIMNTDAISYYVSFDNYNVGTVQGRYIKNALNLDNAAGPFNIEFTAGDPGDNNAIWFFWGAMDVLKPYIDAGKLVVKSGQTSFDQVSTSGWRTENSRSRASSILSSYYSDGSTLDAWVCSNDSTALGVILALEAQYNGKWPVITGQDADLQNVQYIIVGKQAMSVYKQTQALVSQTVKIAGQILNSLAVDSNSSVDNGAKTIRAYMCNPIYVTKGNYRSILIDSGLYSADDFTNLPEPPPQVEPEPVEEPEENKIIAYVTRCYEIILGREPDEGGLNTWYNELNSGNKAAAEIIEQFVGSQEFLNKKLSNSDAVEILYNTMLGRSSDPAGKADWVGKLNGGQPLTAVINGFSGSAEFKAICDSYGIQPGSASNQDTPDGKIKAFVRRCYQIILGREPDEGGMNTWFNELQSGRKAASEIIDSFVRSQEFLNKNYNNGDSVEILYKAMLGRPSDAAGKADWVSKLDAGQPLATVINGFCGSAEFTGICNSYGIQPGSVTVQDNPAASDEKIRAFVARCYKIILGRDADEGGMNTWAGELSSRRKAAAEIIEAFVNSQEFQNKKYSNPDAVEILYKAMLGRGSDAAGKTDWVAKLNNGQPLSAVINGFCGSAEFKAICDAYGITPGTVKVENVNKTTEETAETNVLKTEKKANLVEITNASDTVNENLGTAVQAIYINEEKAKEFIGRCYQAILGREAGAEELNGWIGQMMNGSKTADQIARGFLFSGEFKGRNIGNEELVKILYRVYMNREADAEGLATWTQKLDEGTSLNDLLDIFSKTNEFKAVVRDMAQ